MAERSHDPISVALATLLREKKMTQAELWRAARLSPGAISRYLGGTRGTKIDARGARAMEKVATALRVEPDYFVEYRAWRIREITFACPGLMDDFYDLILETAKLRGVFEDRPDDAKQQMAEGAEAIVGID